MTAIEQTCEIIRANVNGILKNYFPQFTYKGHGNNVGVWETPENVFLSKSFGGCYDIAQIRLWVYIPVKDGQEIHVEMNFRGCGWESMFKGFIPDVRYIRQIFEYHLGIPVVESNKS